ncbi:Hypothetical protein CINCED_3A018010 [Cinara cedri]|uniref:Uncharacterized protein n=1 Tax=Cinara cedri TaxID=506608 RepID=A0A5E4N771_9HEMI|nr:Hypothetical protein CINCED_3A018010 [Cinara cedri]
MRPDAAVYLIAVTVVCVAAHRDYDNDDYDDNRPNEVDRAYNDGDEKSTTKPSAEVKWDDVIPNKCTDPSSGQKYKIGVTWYPDGCGRRTCYYSKKRNVAEIHTEMCTCKKECSAGMKCSIVKRVQITDARYPYCCPTTRCVPEQNLWSYFKKDYWTSAFSKLQQRNDDRLSARNTRRR